MVHHFQHTGRIHTDTERETEDWPNVRRMLIKDLILKSTLTDEKKLESKFYLYSVLYLDRVTIYRVKSI